MANKKLFNSKNIANLIQTLLDNNKDDLAMQILQASEIKSLLPNVLQVLKRKNLKLEDYKATKIYSKTELKAKTLEEIGKILNISTKGSKIIIDEKMSAGVKVKAGDRLIDATLENMLQKGLEELLVN